VKSVLGTWESVSKLQAQFEYHSVQRPCAWRCLSLRLD